MDEDLADGEMEAPYWQHLVINKKIGHSVEECPIEKGASIRQLLS